MKRHQRKLPLPFSFGAILTALLLAVAPFTATSAEIENPVDKLSFAETVARDIRQDTATLRTYVRFPMLYSHESHTRRLTRIRANVNELGDQVEKMHKNRDELNTWQAGLVTRLLPKLQNLTSDTEAAIKFINDTPNADFRPMYESYVDDMYDASNSIVRTIDNFLEWADDNAQPEATTE